MPRKCDIGISFSVCSSVAIGYLADLSTSDGGQCVQVWKKASGSRSNGHWQVSL